MSHFEIYRGKKEYVEKSKQKIKKYSCENIDVYHTVFSTFPGDIFYADASGNKVKRAQETLANSITLRGPAEGEAGKSCTVYAIPSAIVEKFIDSNYVQGYTMEAGTYWLDPVDTETYISEETQQRLKIQACIR